MKNHIESREGEGIMPCKHGVGYHMVCSDCDVADLRTALAESEAKLKEAEQIIEDLTSGPATSERKGVVEKLKADLKEARKRHIREQEKNMHYMAERDALTVKLEEAEKLINSKSVFWQEWAEELAAKL